MAGADTSIITNAVLWRQLTGWREGVAAGKAAQVAREMEDVMAGGAPWRVNVMHGDNWSYQWGFLALNTYAWACQANRDTVRAYRALANATAYAPSAPPPSGYAYYYWRWYVAMGESCQRVGRWQDARWCFEHVRGGLSTNDGLYYKATAALAGLRGWDNPAEARALYEELLSTRPRQPSMVWHAYIRLLFACGRFDDGVAAIFRGARANGFSARHAERDYFIADACRYWHFFRDADVIEWYSFLGEKIDRIRVTRANEALLTLLINTRTLMQRAHPDVLALPEDDVRALADRAMRQRSLPHPSPRVMARIVPAAHSPIDAVACSLSADAAATRAMALEDRVNKILLDARRVSKYNYGPPEPWLQLLRDADTNALTSVYVDGVPVQWLAQASLAIIYGDRRDIANATNWLAQALAGLAGVKNPARLAELCLWVARVEMQQEVCDTTRASHFVQWALSVCPSNLAIRARGQEMLAEIAFLRGGPRARMPILRELVAHSGCVPHQAVYERLARDYFRLGAPRDAVATLFEGLRRCPFKLDEGRFNHFLETLRGARSLLTSAELDQLRACVRSGAMRYPASIANVRASARALALANAAWLDEHAHLAHLEEAGVYSDEDWRMISHCATTRPNVRIGRMLVLAQAARCQAGFNAFDWAGWLLAWRGIPRECEGQPTLGDTGVNLPLYESLLAVLEQHTSRIPFQQQGSFSAVLKDLFKVPNSDDLCDRAQRIIDSFNEPYDTFFFLYDRIERKDTLALDDPLLQRLIAMRPHVPDGWWHTLQTHLRQRAMRDPAHSNQWISIAEN